MPNSRVAIFRDRALVWQNYSHEPIRPLWPGGIDAPAVAEEVALVMDGPCKYCRTPTRRASYPDQDSCVKICPSCGYWGGRGQEWDDHEPWCKAALGVVSYVDINSVELALVELVSHLSALPQRLLDLSPFRAERVVMELLAEVVGCEVKPIGGVKDNGVDGYLIASDSIRTIVQVKWHQDTRKAESVRLVREIAGTLVARGIPRGLLVTTSERLSEAARNELAAVNKKELAGYGRIQLDVRTYNDLVDMLKLAWANINGEFEEAIPYISQCRAFGTAPI